MPQAASPSGLALLRHGEAVYTPLVLPASLQHIKHSDMTTQTRIGWIGLGRMGEAMVKKLTAAGYGVQVWNRTREKALPLAEYGAVIVRDKLELAGCDVVFTMLPSSPISERKKLAKPIP